MPEQIQVITDTPPPETTSIGLGTIIVGVFILGLLVLAVTALIAWLVYKFRNYFKFKDNPYWQIRDKRITLCRQHGDKHRMPQKFYRPFSIQKNQPIICQYSDIQGNMHSKKIGYYNGHYQTADDNIIMAFKDHVHKIFYIVPEMNIIVLNRKEKYKIRTKDEASNLVVDQEVRYPKVQVEFLDDFIVIHALGIDDAEYFYVPVIKDKQGNVIDMRLPAYISAREISIHKFTYAQTQDYLAVNRDHMKFNPVIKAGKELSDTNGQIDTTPP
jgi:hypothetical protein